MGNRGKLQLAAYAAGALLLAFAALHVLEGGGPGGEGPRVALDGPGAGQPGAGAPTPKRPRLYIHVVGAVREGGLYRLPDGARVATAIERAGGASSRADLSGVNLAAPLADGQQVVVPRRGEVARGAAASGTGGDAQAPVSLSQATPEQLEQLDGIGPALAARIVEYRDEHGGFRSLGQLRDVEGIGEKRFKALRESVQP